MQELRLRRSSPGSPGSGWPINTSITTGWAAVGGAGLVARGIGRGLVFVQLIVNKPAGETRGRADAGADGYRALHKAFNS